MTDSMLSSKVLSDLEKVLTYVSDGTSAHASRTRKQAPPPTGERRTTLMIKNLPNRYSRAMVVSLLEERLPSGAFDFVYVPIDFSTRQNFAYAFFNLTSPGLVKVFMSAFSGFRFSLDSGKGKTCEVVFARVQGIEANVNRLINSPILTACCRANPDDTALPLVFIDNEPVRFSELLLTAVPRDNALLAWTPGSISHFRLSSRASPVLTPSALLPAEDTPPQKADAAAWITETLIKEMMALLDTCSDSTAANSPSGGRVTPSLSSVPIYYDQLPTNQC